ncbi:MAG: DUF1761 domain-containing protein [Gemmatimonadetes bacterium]|nr:DUF1761 domain-containing protein [Gemmatimonadota bacterium]
MSPSSINLVPALIAGIVTFLLGGLWYGPLFGAKWMASVGVTAADLKPPVFATGFLSYIVLAGSLSVLLNWTGADSIGAGMVVGLVAWVGTALALGANTAAFSGRPRRAFAIESAFQLVAFLAIGGILGGWQ